MKNLVQGYELLDKGLKDYTIQKIFMTYKCLEIVAKSQDGTNTLKLQFDGIDDILFGKYDVDAVISEMKLEKTDDNMLQVQIENLEDVEMKIMAKKLVVTKM